jgi:dethiobiotin synthetase
MKGVFITGTDTGVGKTIIAAAIGRAVTGLGYSTAVMKPVETGCRRDGPVLVPHDGSFLLDMSGSDIPLSDVTPYRFETPVAPLVASETEGLEINTDLILDTFYRLSSRHDFIIVEGVGGIMVPVRDDMLIIDLIKAMDLPVVIVAMNKLGMINHTLLTVNAALDRGITVKGVIINSPSLPTGDMAEETNPSVLKRLLKVPLLGEFPYLEGINKGLIDEASKHIDIARVIADPIS